MFLDYAENSLQLGMAVVALLLSLFRYIGSKKRGWIYPVIIFLCSLASSYYWTAYLLIMGDSPNVSNAFTYVGWNIALAVMIPFVLHFKTPAERRYFHPLMLLPIPLNLYQLSLYLPFGGEVNSIYQVTVCTVASCLCVQSLCWYRKHRGDGAKFPYVAIAVLLFDCFEFGMWTSTCFDGPVAYLYYPFSFLCSLDYLLITWSVRRSYGAESAGTGSRARRRLERILKIVYLSVVVVCAFGGVLLGAWMRDTITVGTQEASADSIYAIIPVVLFVISLVIAAFAIAIIFVVSLSEKAAESDKLREEKVIAEHSNAAKSEFLANMSHEIRTPINAILGMNEIILRQSLQAKDQLPPERETIRSIFSEIGLSAGNIESAGNNLLSIINDILDFSKIEAGRLEIIEGNYKLSSVLNDVSNMIMFKARAKGLSFNVDVDDTLPDGLYGDEVRVRQIITNLLNNAVKYTDRGSVTLSLHGEMPEAGGHGIRLIIAVQDTGIGIRPEDMDKLFQKFQRFNLDRNRTVEGTGLGLAITQRLLGFMGGTIDVKSRQGEGSTFTVSIPQQVVSREPVGNFRKKFEESIEDTRARRESFRAPEARILIVDDTPMNLAVAKGLLKHTEIQIDTASGGPEAIEKARVNRYDLILMDQRMPGMDGTEAMHRIREQEKGASRQTPIICLTADAVTGAKEKYLAEGFADYLTKPINSQALEQMLMKYLPEEKVKIVRDGSGERRTEIPEDREAAARLENGAETETENRYAPLRKAGVVPETGMQYCQMDEAFYQSLLQEYAKSAGEKAREIRRDYEQKDWKNYAILVHSVKSTSRMIGAEALADLAAGLEKAADEGREDAVTANHSLMLTRYETVAGAVRTAFPESENSAEADDAPMEFGPEEDGILEFLPESENGN